MTPAPARPRPRGTSLPWLQRLCCLLLLTGGLGCSRTFWRDQADRDSYLAITEKLNDPRWALPRIDVTANPESRFYDPYNPDFEPLPPDDGAASVYMKWVDGWQGYKGWHKFGDVMSVENPQWLANFGISTHNIDPLTGQLMGPLPELKNVTLPQAVELAQIDNRDYQNEIENVYLAALAVTYQRFQFGVRYLTANGVEPTAVTTSTFVPNGPGGNVASGVAGGVSQLLPAGTQCAVEFANNTVWLFSGGNQTQSVSNLSFSLLQPLLFGAGRKVGLEGLTQTERNLLYEARILARLRQQIFTDVVGGSTGFLQLLVELQQIRNLRGNIGRLEEQIEKLLSLSARNKQFASVELNAWPANTPLPAQLGPPLQNKLQYDADLRKLRWNSLEEVTEAEIQLLRNLSPDPVFQRAVAELVNTLQTNVATLDVLNLQSSLANSTNQLRNLERTLQDDQDSYKILLGLRTDMVFSIDDALLKQFELVDPRLSAIEESAKDLVQTWDGLVTGNQDLELMLMGEANDEAIRPLLEQGGLKVSRLRDFYVELLALVDLARRNGMQVVSADMESTRRELPRRLQELSEPDQATLLSDLERAEILLTEAGQLLDELREAIVETARGLRSDEVAPTTIVAAYRQLYEFRERLVKLAQNLTVIQISLRVELIEVQPFELAQQESVAIGVDNRVDLMNARAYVMDARRKVEIAANALLSSVNIVVDGDINTPVGNRPFDFRGSRSQLRAGFSFTAPLDQIDERNAYRISLINYQRQRRAYMLAEDQVKQQIRNAWRQLFVLRQNLETSRRAVRIAALQYDAAVEQSNNPGTGQTSSSSSSSRSSGSGLAGNNLISALNNILNAQNTLVSTYMNYERNRLNIYRDMGIMEIGEDGMWVDPFYRSQLDEFEEKSLRPPVDVVPPLPAPVGAGRSRLGRRHVDAGLVAIPDHVEGLTSGTEESDPRFGTIRTVSGQLEPAGVSR